MSTMAFGYDQAERYLRSLELFGMRFGLDRMRRLMTVLDSPHQRYETVQVVGTNGKSSTARMIAAVLERHEMRTGAYLSPHLTSFAERVEVGGRSISPTGFAAAVQRAAQAAELVDRGLDQGDRVTQFEALTAAAFWSLAQAGVRVAVVEAGLGGRFDATSVVSPRVVVLTNVGLEHTRWLGPTARHIAEEKLAVVPPGGVLVAGALGADVLDVATRICLEREATMLLAGRDFEIARDDAGLAVTTGRCRYGGIELRPLGRFQELNYGVALVAAEQLRGRTLEIEAVRTTASELRLPGRLEVVGTAPLVVHDGAHNPEAARALRPSLAELAGSRRLVAVLSILDDKDAAGILTELLPLCERVVFTRSANPRALPAATLESLGRQLDGPPSEVVPEPAAALERARALAGPDGVVAVTGSMYLLSDLVRPGVREAAAADGS